MLLTAALALRITEDLRAIQSVAVLDDNQLHSFLKANSPAVLFFGNRSHFMFASFSVDHYRKRFKFSFSTATAAASLNLTDLPLAALFNGSSRVHSVYRGTSAIGFAHHCQFHLWFALPRAPINLPEELRRILASPIVCIFGLDSANPFAAFRNDVPFFAVRADIFRMLALKVASGYYAYRGIERALVRIPDTKLRTYREYLKTPLVRMDAVNFTQRRWLAGFLIDERNDTAAEEQIRILKELAGKFQGVAFTPIGGENGEDITEIGDLIAAKQAAFVVWKDALTAKRWVFSGDEIWNETRLAARLEEITSDS